MGIASVVYTIKVFVAVYKNDNFCANKTELENKKNIVWSNTCLIGCNPHHLMLQAWISLTLSRHFFLSFIASGRSSWPHPVSSHNCWMYVQAGHPVFAWPYAGVHESTSLMSSSLLLQQCPACLVRLTWIVFVMGGR